MCSILPDKLGEVAGTYREIGFVKVVVFDFVVPSINSSGRIGKAHGKVFAVWATRVSKDTVLVVEVVLGIACKGV